MYTRSVVGEGHQGRCGGAGGGGLCMRANLLLRKIFWRGETVSQVFLLSRASRQNGRAVLLRVSQRNVED